MTSTKNIPARVLTQLHSFDDPWLHGSYCAGFEVKSWRCGVFADHIIEWMPDYALKEDELKVNPGNMYIRMKEAAVRVYSTKKYEGRGEVGEIALHAICRDFFDTVPLAPRVFYLTASNDVVKSFDMVHVRYVAAQGFEIWLGESKFYKSAAEAVASAITSVSAHIDAGFLKREKLLIAPQVSKDLPHSDEIRKMLATQTSLDELFKTAVFPILIAADSKAVNAHTAHSDEYRAAVEEELAALREKVSESGLHQTIRVNLIYVPLASKAALAKAFDRRIFVKRARAEADYSLFVQSISRWFKAEELKNLDEEGIPIQVSERFHAGEGKQSLIEKLIAAALARSMELSAFERRWILAAFEVDA